MKNSRTPSRKVGRNILIAIVLLLLLFVFKNNILSSFKIFNNLIEGVNFRLVRVKESIYSQTSKFKSRVNDLSYLGEYVENNKNRDFELQKSKIQNMELATVKQENQKLREMLEMRAKAPTEYIAADVALVENFNSSERLFIDKGQAEGITLNLPVLYDGYLIGKITKVGESYSEVTLLTSKSSKMSILLNGTDMQILRGNGNGTFSIFNYNENVDEKSKFLIETSGTSDIFPKGIKIGSFQIVEVNAFKQTREMRFKPSYNIYDMQNVLVYKWSKNDKVNFEIQNQINFEIEQEFQKNKGTTQTN